MKKSFFVLITVLLPLGLFAQYDNIRFPQTAEEIALYKKLGVQSELQQLQGENGELANYAGRMFNPEGKIMGYKDYTKRQYYLYDDRGRVSSFLDSTFDGERFTVKELSFQYDGRGMLAAVNGQEGLSTLTYNEAKKVLVEKTPLDSPATMLYRYTPAGLLTEVSAFDNGGRLLEHDQFNYTTNGLIYNETLVKYGTNGSKDSVLRVYIYDQNKRVSKKQEFTFSEWLASASGDGKATHQGSHYEDGNYSYTYDKNGRLVSEEYINKRSLKGGYYKTWTYDENGLVKKSTVKTDLSEPQIFHHKYTFYNK